MEMNNPDILKDLLWFGAFMIFGGLLITQVLSYGLDYFYKELKLRQKRRYEKNKMDSQR